MKNAGKQLYEEEFIAYGKIKLYIQRKSESESSRANEKAICYDFDEPKDLQIITII